ncbi:unnamed protein product [Ectocarpus sp. CCAP 1310/34]|nr:unnamed protein product [Ectocarpus sp. CCAP 1310/34]
MRPSSTMTLLAAASGAFLASIPAVDGVKAIFDLRTGEDYESDNNCVDSEARKVRYLQIEGFDYNSSPWMQMTWSNLHPSGITYEGCYSAGIFGTADGPTGSANDADPAENYRMFDGIDDDGVNADKVMTLEKCAATCTAQGTRYFGLESAVKCLCGDELAGSPTDDVYGEGGSVCGIDITFGGDVPEYKYLCSGDSRVLCGTDDHISVYSLDGSTGGGDDDSGDPPVGSEFIGCVADSQDDRVMSVGPIAEDTMSAEMKKDLKRNSRLSG